MFVSVPADASQPYRFVISGAHCRCSTCRVGRRNADPLIVPFACGDLRYVSGVVLHCMFQPLRPGGVKENRTFNHYPLIIIVRVERTWGRFPMH